VDAAANAMGASWTEVKIWKLNQKLGIPAECLIQPPKLPLAA
jgi:hypothetical protein